MCGSFSFLNYRKVKFHDVGASQWASVNKTTRNKKGPIANNMRHNCQQTGKGGEVGRINRSIDGQGEVSAEILAFSPL